MQLPVNKTCPIADTLSVLGQKWNLLLLREAFMGSSRFTEFQRIGIPSATLGARLEGLVAEGLLERRTYQEVGERARNEYGLTQAGRDAISILAALAEWGEAHLQEVGGHGVVLVGPRGQDVHLQFVDDQGVEVPADGVVIARRGGLPSTGGKGRGVSGGNVGNRPVV